MTWNHLYMPFVSWSHPEDTHSSEELHDYVVLLPPLDYLFAFWLSACSCGCCGSHAVHIIQIMWRWG